MIKAFLTFRLLGAGRHLVVVKCVGIGVLLIERNADLGLLCRLRTVADFNED
jgi:hypothetical protein